MGERGDWGEGGLGRGVMGREVMRERGDGGAGVMGELRFFLVKVKTLFSLDDQFNKDSASLDTF